MSIKFITDVIDFWFKNPKVWFASTYEDDNNISRLFYEGFLLYNDYDFDDKYLVGHIIMLDQLPRHFYRNNIDKNYKINLHLNKALKILETKCIEHYIDYEYTFCLLPYRHTFDPKIIHKSIDLIRNKCSNWKSNKAYVRFYKASINSLSNIYSKESTSCYYSILSYLAFDYRYKNIQSFYYDTFKIPTNTTPNYLSLDSIFDNHRDSTPILSFSGGVDSSILFYILIQMRYHNIINDFKVVYIRHYNRIISSSIEEAFVTRMCIENNVEYKIRGIREFTRKTCINRSFYEDHTRKVRFETYRSVVSDDGHTNVILGHNRNDILENIIMNIGNGKWNNIDNMYEQEKYNEVNLIRPLLKYDKNYIYKYANEYNIRHTRNNTPKTCDRGIIRNELFPLMLKINSSILDNLLELPSKIKIVNVYKYTIDKVNCNVIIDFEDNKDLILETFNKTIYNIFKEMLWKKIPSRKSIAHLMMKHSKKSLGNNISLTTFIYCKYISTSKLYISKR